MTDDMPTETQSRGCVQRVVRRFPGLSPEAVAAMSELLSGTICVPAEAVVQELGKVGLAYRRDLRSRSRRLALTAEGAKFISPND